MSDTPKELKHWQQEKDIIPEMIAVYCHGNHGTKKNEICDACKDLTEYALFRLEKCPFKENKSFCSTCKVHCYKPEYREQIKAVMKYAGPRMLPKYPVFSIGHVTQMIKYKRSLKANNQ